MRAVQSNLTIGKAWAASPKNMLRDRAFDGRVIACHLAWISPDLQRETDQQALCDKGAAVDTPYGQIILEIGRGGVLEEEVKMGIDLLVEAQMCTFPLLCRQPIPGPSVRDFAIADGSRSGGGNLPISVLSALNVLGWSASQVVRAWQEIMIDWNCKGITDQPIRSLQDVTRLLDLCLRFLFVNRLLAKISHADPMSAALRAEGDRCGDLLLANPPTMIFQSSANESIVAEMVSYHYPFWDRSYFCFNSPWDNFRDQSNSLER